MNTVTKKSGMRDAASRLALLYRRAPVTRRQFRSAQMTADWLTVVTWAITSTFTQSHPDQSHVFRPMNFTLKYYRCTFLSADG